MTVIICKSLQTQNIKYFKLKIRLYPSLKINDVDGILVKTSWLTSSVSGVLKTYDIL